MEKLGVVKMEYKNPPVELPGIAKTKRIKLPDIGTSYREIKTAYFVFIDVLGFKDTFQKGKFSENVQSVFEYFNLLVSQIQFLKREENNNCYAGQTSDSLYFYTDNLGYLTRFINVFLHFNIYAMSQGVYFRGGISTGNLFVNKPYQFYGNCVIKSFSLEEYIACHPRIAIDKATKNKFKKTPNGWKFDYDEENDRWFINPFSDAIYKDIGEDLGIPNGEFLNINYDLILEIKKNIAANKENFEFNDKLYQKYSYLLKSCNELIESANEENE